MKTIVPITEWKNSVCLRGKFKGRAVKTRWCIFADKWNWFFGKENGGSAPVQEAKYFARFEQLFPVMIKMMGFSDEEFRGVLENLNSLFAEKLNKDKIKNFSGNPELDGRAIDDHYKVNHHRDEGFYEKI